MCSIDGKLVIFEFGQCADRNDYQHLKCVGSSLGFVLLAIQLDHQYYCRNAVLKIPILQVRPPSQRNAEKIGGDPNDDFGINNPKCLVSNADRLAIIGFPRSINTTPLQSAVSESWVEDANEGSRQSRYFSPVCTLK